MAAPIEIRIDVLDAEVKAAFQRGRAAGTDFTPAMKAIATFLETDTRLNFEQERAPDGRPWKPSRRVVEHGGKTLTLTGDLSSSIASDYGPEFAAAGPERSFGAAVYAAIHQFGGEIVPRVKKALSFGGAIFARIIMPARPYLGFNQAATDRVAEILLDFLGDAFAGRPA